MKRGVKSVDNALILCLKCPILKIGVRNRTVVCSPRLTIPTGRTPGFALSITHKFSTDADAQLNINEAS
jgi:hypothetical protein